MVRAIWQLLNGGGVTGGVFFFIATIFQVWMLIDAVRRREYIWAVLIFLFSVFTAVFYFFLVYRAAASSNPLAGFELPGAADRRQIARLKAEIHHLDKAHLHQQLGDIYFNQGRSSRRPRRASAPPTSAIRRMWTSAPISAVASRGSTGRRRRCRSWQAVCAENPRHDYGYTLMTLAEAQASAGRTEARAGHVAPCPRALSIFPRPRAVRGTC